MFLVLTKKKILPLFFLIDLLELLSFEKLDLFGDDSDDDGSGYGSPETCAFPFCSGNFVDCVSGVGSSVLFRLESIQLVALFRCSCYYQEESSPKVVDL